MYTAACPDRATTAPVYGTVVARFFCSGCRDTGKALYRHPRAVRNQIFSFGRPTNTSATPASAALRRLSKPVRRKTGLFRVRRPARGGGGRFSAGNFRLPAGFVRLFANLSATALCAGRPRPPCKPRKRPPAAAERKVFRQAFLQKGRRSPRGSAFAHTSSVTTLFPSVLRDAKPPGHRNTKKQISCIRYTFLDIPPLLFYYAYAA